MRLVNVEEVRARVQQLLPEAVFAGDRLTIAMAGGDAMPGLVKMLSQAGAEIIEAKMEGAALEQLYLEIVEGKGASALGALP